MWGATAALDLVRAQATISIHAPRVGRDGGDGSVRCNEVNISIHAPRVGRDDWLSFSEFCNRLFQSTRPVWGATACKPPLPQSEVISIHAPRVGRDVSDVLLIASDISISIHAPRVGRDSMHLDVSMKKQTKFQSTRPVWGATCRWRFQGLLHRTISIHAPRVGRD